MQIKSVTLSLGIHRSRTPLCGLPSQSSGDQYSFAFIPADLRAIAFKNLFLLVAPHIRRLGTRIGNDG
jgi:hypothetical protein